MILMREKIVHTAASAYSVTIYVNLAKTARECNLASVNRTVDKSKLSVNLKLSIT